MKTEGQFLLVNRDEFREWLFNTHFDRKITHIQNHHTYEPNHNDFNVSNHFELLQSMRNYHILYFVSGRYENPRYSPLAQAWERGRG